MGFIRSLIIIINYKSVLVTALSLISTFICIRTGFTADFPLTIVGVAIVFPIVFSISGAYKRREAALREYGSIKAHGRAIYFAVRDWIEVPDESAQADFRATLKELIASCRDLFHTPVSQMNDNEIAVYSAFARLSKLIERLRAKNLSVNEVSRCNQYLSKMIVSFESIKHIYQYRTPKTLRTYSKFFIFVIPIIYGPYFATIAMGHMEVTAYIMPVLFSIVFVSLDNIQDHLENPFDLVGEDDIVINPDKFESRLDS